MGRKEEVAQRLRIMRKSRGYTQKALASLMGISPSSISMYETGEREPDFETLESFADVFNVSMNDIIGDDIIEIETACADIGETIPVLTAPDGMKDVDDMNRLEAMHKSPRLQLLFDCQRRMSDHDIELMLKIADRILKSYDHDLESDR